MLTRSLSTLDRMLTLNRVLDDVLTGAVATAGETRAWVPALDVIEGPDTYLIAVDLAGVDPATIDVTFEQNVLSVRGTKPLGFELAGKEYRVHAAERVAGAFERSVRLPEFVDGNRISAECTHGVLHLTVPKMKEAQARKISINGVESKQIAQ